MKIHVLTDNEDIRSTIGSYILDLGHEYFIFKKPIQVREKSKCNIDDQYYLIVDYLNAPEETRQMLLEILTDKTPPSGLLVTSSLPGFEDFMDKVSMRYADADIPFLFMEKPFSRLELKELLCRLERRSERIGYGCLQSPKYTYAHIGEFGPILRAARKNLGLEPEQILPGARNKGIWLTIDRLTEIESDKKGSYISYYQWLVLTNLLYESPDCSSTGFDPWMHLRRVQRALNEKTYPFAMNFALRRKLVDLAKRERIERNFLAITNYGMYSRLS